MGDQNYSIEFLLAFQRYIIMLCAMMGRFRPKLFYYMVEKARTCFWPELIPGIKEDKHFRILKYVLKL